MRSPAGGTGLPRVPAAFAPAPAAWDRLRGLPAIVVVQAPRGYGKTTTVSAWLRRRDLPDHDLVWLTLPNRPLDGPGLWTLVHEALAVPGPAGPEAVAGAVRGLRQHLVLVLDHYERLTAPAVDGELVELAQSAEHLHLVILTRVVRPVLALARAGPDAVVLQAADLLLTEREVARLAAALGRPLSGSGAAALCAGLAGWPGAVRVAVLAEDVTAAGTLVADPAGLAGYLRIALADLDVDAVVPTALAVPAVFTADTAADLLGPDARGPAEAVLARLRRAGLLRATPTGYAYPPLLRAAAAHLLREDDPARFRGLHARAARRCQQEGEAAGALTHALAAEDRALLCEVLERFWPHYVGNGLPVLRQALSRLEAETSPVLSALRAHVAPADPPRWFLQALQSGLPVTGPGHGAEPAGDPDRSRAQLAVGTALLAGADLLPAAHALYEAHRGCADEDETRREAAAGLALTLLLLGHLPAAERWLTAAPAGTDEAPGPLAAVAAAAVPALAALDRLGSAEVPPPPPLPPTARWLEAVLVYAWAVAGLHGGRARQTALAVERYLEQGAGASRLGRLLVTTVLVDLCIAAEDYERARELAAAVPIDPDGLWRRVAQARLALFLGREDDALQLTAEAGRSSAVRCRPALKLAVVRAVAAHRTGDRAEAADALHLAAAIAEQTGMLRPFALVPRADLDAVAAAAPGAAAPARLVARAEEPGPFRDAAVTAPLTAREIQVLRELATGRPVVLIARRMFVSESTVKTQVRSIYRKLDVHTRQDAVRLGRTLRLVPGAPA